MKIDKEKLKKLEELSKIELSDEEREVMLERLKSSDSDIAKILEWFSQRGK